MLLSFSKCSVKNANKQYSKLNNEHELTFKDQEMFELCEDNVGDSLTITYNFTNNEGGHSQETAMIKAPPDRGGGQGDIMDETEEIVEDAAVAEADVEDKEEAVVGETD